MSKYTYGKEGRGASLSSENTPYYNSWRVVITKRTVKIVGTLLLILLLSSIVSGTLYFNRQKEINQINELRQNNNDKDEMITELTTQIEKLEGQQERIDSKQEEIKKLIGITSEEEDLPLASPGGQGGEWNIGLNAADPLTRGQDIINQWDMYEKELNNYIAQVNNDRQYFRSLPNKWPVHGEISSMYGWRVSPFGGKKQTFHNGIDIAGYGGENIVAAGDGKVIFSGWNGSYGRTIKIDHGSGFVSMYGHNSALLVKVGQEVKKGDLIARLGNSGLSTGPHLHFTIFRWDESYDPLIYLPAQ